LKPVALQWPLVSRREKEKKESLDALSKIAYAVGGGNPAPAKPAAPPKSAPPAAPRPKPSPKPAPAPASVPYEPAAAQAERARRLQMEDRKAKLEEERMLRARRQGELARGATSQWRGMDQSGVPTGIRRTAFDRQEPSLQQKLSDVLGDAKIKEGREKHRAKGSRQGGR
jgi:hypothetical protein